MRAVIWGCPPALSWLVLGGRPASVHGPLFWCSFSFVQLSHPWLWRQWSYHRELCLPSQVCALLLWPGSSALCVCVWGGLSPHLLCSPLWLTPYPISSLSASLVALLLTRASETSWLPTLLTSSMFALTDCLSLGQLLGFALSFMRLLPSQPSLRYHPRLALLSWDGEEEQGLKRLTLLGWAVVLAPVTPALSNLTSKYCPSHLLSQSSCTAPGLSHSQELWQGCRACFSYYCSKYWEKLELGCGLVAIGYGALVKWTTTNSARECSLLFFSPCLGCSVSPWCPPSPTQCSCLLFAGLLQASVPLCLNK